MKTKAKIIAGIIGTGSLALLTAAPASAGTELGGLNLNAYCQGQTVSAAAPFNYAYAEFTDGSRYDSWRCVATGLSGNYYLYIDFNTACQYAYGATNQGEVVTSGHYRDDDVYSVFCQRG